MNKKILILILLVGGGAFFFFQNDEKYLKKKTLKLLNSIKAPSADLSAIAFLRKIQNITKHVHFSVHYEVKWESKSYQKRSLNNLRSDLQAWFKQKPPHYKMEMPSLQNITVSILHSKTSQENTPKDLPDKKAKVIFKVPLTYKEQKILCQTTLDWGKAKSWLIYKILVLCHKE